MEEKLEKLAIARRRLSSRYPQNDFGDEDLGIAQLTFYEDEDRKSGLFPYDSNVQTITDFYKGKDVLITGGTGFVGKVLIEKILRSLPKGGRIFLLLRGRKGLTPQQRVQAMLELPLFKVVMNENPDAANRIVPVEGDCACLGLGLSQADRQTIVDNVSIVFHCAATVRFHLPLSYVVLMNTRGTREMVFLCKELKKLDAFVYVSTAYTCATNDRVTSIPEAVEPVDMDWKTIIAAAERSVKSSNSDGFDLIFEKLQNQHPTNYTFSKLLAEYLVEEECRGLPVITVRPSVLLGTYEDPFGGWVDNMYGPFTIWDGIGRGIVRAHYGNKHTVLDFLPVDWHVKTLICAAWHRGLNFRMRSDPEKMDVVNNCSSNFCKRSFATQMAQSSILYDVATYKFIPRYPRFHMTTNYWVFWFITVTSHLPFGCIIDTVLKGLGKKPLLLNAYRRLFFAQTKFIYRFCTRDFNFDGKWQWVLAARIPKEDKDRFDMTAKSFQFSFGVDMVAGIITFVFKKTPVSGEQSNRKIMLIVDWIHTAILVGLGLWMLTWINGKFLLFLLFIFVYVMFNG